MEQLFPRTLAEVPNSLLSYPILKMGIDAAKGWALVQACTCRLEIVVSKSTIAAMVVQNPYAMLLSKVLKSLFGVNCLLQSETSHQMDV